MGVIRMERDKNFTHMANYHLRDKTLSLRAVGLMSKMLSLKEDWSYSVAGLASICKEGREAVRKVLQELEEAGYLIREQSRQGGHFAGYDYTLHELPQTRDPDRCPDFWATDDPPLPRIPLPGSPLPGNAPQSNTIESNTKESITSPPIVPPEGDRRVGTPPQVKASGRPKTTREPKTTAEWKPERFEGFWKYYPAIPDGNGHGRRPKRDRAIAAWDKLRPDDETIDRMAAALKAQKASRQWREGIGIPYASTWLNGRGWEEEVVTMAPSGSEETNYTGEVPELWT